MKPLRWKVGDVQLAFSTATDGDLREQPLRQAWLAKEGIDAPCHVVKQVHGKKIVVAGENLGRDADGLVSASRGLALGVFGADCPGICVVAPDAFGVAHCGWRGTAAGIVGSLVESLARLSEIPRSQWQAFIGPGIGSDEYEVDTPVISARTWPSGALRPTRAEHARLDIAIAIRADLAAAGVDRVTESGCCTATDPRLWSYRRRGSGLVQLLVAWRDARLT